MSKQTRVSHHREQTLLTISIGVPDLEAKVAACRRRSWGRRWMPTNRPAFRTIILAAL